MKFGIFSDVHSNVEAFVNVLDAMEREKVDRYLFLGDLVGYGAEPRECIKLLKGLMKKAECICVGGNHDCAVCGMTDYTHYDPYAQEAIEWTREQLDASEKEFLSRMRLVEHVDDMTLVHANLIRPEKWGYILDMNDALPNFKQFTTSICFVGHSHRPAVFSSAGRVREGVVFIRDNIQYIINAGSVGQPRDGDPRAAFAVYDADKKRLDMKRISYDIARTQKKIIAAGLPVILAERLSVGK